MSTQPKHLLTPEEYLEIERNAVSKSEYYQGEMFAMSGGASAHSLIATNISFLLNFQVRSRDCFVYNSDMRIRVSDTGLYTYPDVSVVCGQRKFLDDRRDVLLNPSVIIEVLSPSTEAYDRGRKFEHYRSIDSLNAYFMIASERIHVELYTRQSAGQWLLIAVDRLEDTIELESIGCRLGVSEIYEKAVLDIPPTAG